MDTLTTEHTQSIRKEIEALPGDSSSAEIEQAARQLEGDCYEPLLIHKPANFLRITKDGLLSFIDELAVQAKSEEITEQDLNLLLHQYRFLQRLRKNDPEAWDEVTELWEED